MLGASPETWGCSLQGPTQTAASEPRVPRAGRVGGGRPAGVCAGHRCHRATQGPVRGGAACRPRSPSASRTRGQAQVDRLPRCRPVLPPERPRGLPAVPCRIPAPSQSHLFTIRRPRDSEVTDRHRQRRSLRTRLALRLCVPPGPGTPGLRGALTAPWEPRCVGVVRLCDALVERLSFAGCVGGGGGHPRQPLSFSQISSRLPELQGRVGAGSSGPQEAVDTPRHQASGPGRQEEPWFPLTGCSLNTSASAGVSRWRGGVNAGSQPVPDVTAPRPCPEARVTAGPAGPGPRLRRLAHRPQGSPDGVLHRSFLPQLGTRRRA